ncbi:MAG TPA: hypothetical protein VF399_09740 [bacterium]|jgi:photosystem II stability/assembly factor-like uncharacterized protein
MKFLPIFLLVFIAFGMAAWEAVGPYGGYIRPVMVSYSNENIVYAVSYTYPSAVAKSTNGGATWTTVGSISGNGYSGAIDPTNQDKVYVGTGSYFYRTTNGGTNWSSTYVANTYPYGLVVNNLVPSTIYGAGYAYDNVKWRMAFFKSTDSGVSWSTVYLYDSSAYGYGVAINRTNPNIVYVCGYSYYNSTYVPLIYKSTNGGTNWTLTTTGIPSTAYYINSIAVHPTNPNIVYAGAYSGIYRSIDAGATWTQTSTHYYNYGMAVSSASPNVAYAAGYTDIFKTTDAGVTWATASTGFQGSYPYFIAMSHTGTQVAYYGDNKGIFKTTDAGSSWFDTNNNLNIGSIGSFAVAPSSASTIYTSFKEVGVYKTTNSCTSWSILPTPVGCGNICEFAVNNTNPNIVYALEGSG